jgi:hypothetical protein
MTSDTSHPTSVPSARSGDEFGESGRPQRHHRAGEPPRRRRWGSPRGGPGRRALGPRSSSSLLPSEALLVACTTAPADGRSRTCRAMRSLVSPVGDGDRGGGLRSTNLVESPSCVLATDAADLADPPRLMRGGPGPRLDARCWPHLASHPRPGNSERSTWNTSDRSTSGGRPQTVGPAQSPARAPRSGRQRTCRKGRLRRSPRRRALRQGTYLLGWICPGRRTRGLNQPQPMCTSGTDRSRAARLLDRSIGILPPGPVLPLP